MKKLTRARVVPTIAASVSWLTLGINVSGGQLRRPSEFERDVAENFTLWRILKGEHSPNVETLVSLARVLSVDPGWLINDALEWPPLWSNAPQPTRTRGRRQKQVA